MKREAYLKEMEFMKDWSIVVMNFLMSISEEQMKNVYEIGKSTLNQRYEKRIFRGFKEGFRDINNMIRDLPSSQYDELNTILIEKFGKSIEEASGTTKKLQQKILKRGRILNDDEYRVVQDRIDEVYADESSAEEFEILKAMTLAYEAKKLHNKTSL